ncbi:4'-phosphopantetheinyl transferase family protein [Streptomyces sp. NPDC003379]
MVVWHIPLGAGPGPDGYPPALEDLLDDDEKARARRGQRPGMRRRFVIAHAATRIIVGAQLGRAPDTVRFERGRWGKPAVAGVEQPHFNLSHSGDLALLALAPRPVGVDVEEARTDLDGARLARRFFPEEERELVESGGRNAFTRLWVRKEACVKAAGGRLTQGMGLPVAHTDAQVIVRHSTGPLPGPWRVADLPLPEGRAGAVALVGERPFHVSLRMWRPIPQDTPPSETRGVLREEAEIMSAGAVSSRRNSPLDQRTCTRDQASERH